MLITLLFGACASSAPSNPADRFAGTWSGTMSMTDDPTVSAVAIVTISTGCSVNQPCGDATNTSNGCKWEMTLDSVKEDVLEYSYSKSSEGDCATLGSGTLTLNPDGTLFREHKFPDFTISGTFTRR
jgi:hypothetical protein